MTELIIFMSMVIVFLSYNFYGYYKKNQLFKKVKWCVCDSFSIEQKLRDYILITQQKLSLDTNYRITRDEFSIIGDILKSYQQDLIQKYFAETLPNDKHDNVAFFILTLGDYLEKHQCDTTFNGNEMYIVKNRKTYDTWGVTSFSATYFLTDYAVTYNKLRYITQLYFLKLFNIVGEEKLGVISANATKEAIDSGELQVNNF